MDTAGRDQFVYEIWQRLSDMEGNNDIETPYAVVPVTDRSENNRRLHLATSEIECFSTRREAALEASTLSETPA